jgi:hypothetical protein
MIKLESCCSRALLRRFAVPERLLREKVRRGAADGNGPA